MKISQSLPSPDNWKDFERLCKKLWGEIWDCQEITMNGPNGQNQSGIDISGIPKGENAYYGIQCKGKDRYSQKQLTEKEILEEIEKAKTFEPALKKMYFSTTALKDAKIETFVRKKNLEHIEKGIFEVHLYSWEDIVDLIEENRSTYDYYLNSNSFKTNQSVKVTFKNGETEMTVTPKFQKIIRVGKTKREKLEKLAAENMTDWITKFQQQQRVWDKFNTPMAKIVTPKPKKEFNRSLFESTVIISNDGSEPLENLKLIISLPKEIESYETTNFDEKNSYFVPVIRSINRYTHFKKSDHTINVEPLKKILVGDDSISSDKYFLKSVPEEISLEISWKLISRNFKTEGKLILNIEPEWEINIIKVNDDSPLLLDESKRVTIENFIESIDDELF